jgi:DNA-binding CsgD family transcriptional regulator
VTGPLGRQLLLRGRERARERACARRCIWRIVGAPAGGSRRRHGRTVIRQPGPRSVSDRLSEAARRSFVGRDAELSLLRGAIGAPELPFQVAFVHGPGGIGKSRLIAALETSIVPKIGFVSLDCREIEPTPRGYLAALGTALDADDGEPQLDAVAARLGAGAGRTVLALDTYESAGLIDSWMRRTFVPALPETVLTIIAGRMPPNPAWLTTPGWQDLFWEIELRALPPADAERMLVARGIDRPRARRVNRFARGHPLALELAAAALRERPEIEIDLAPPPRVVHQLTKAFVAELPPDSVEVLEAASTVRRVTEPILGALLRLPSARRELELLRALPVADSTLEGVVIHDVVRDSVARDLAHRDPGRYVEYRWRACRLFTHDSQRDRGRSTWDATADLLYLITNRSVREGFFPQGASEHAVEPAVEPDGDEIAAIASAAEGPEAAALIARWWERHPEVFRVARDAGGGVAAFFLLFQPGDADPALLASDPLTAAWMRQLEAHPLARRERALFLRRWLSRETGEAPSSAQGACWIDIKRSYMELRPRLRRLYTAVIDLATYAPMVEPLRFVPVPAADVELDGVVHRTASLDFGPGSVDGWLSGLIEAELRGGGAGEVEAARPEGAAGLSPRELEVLRLLADGVSNRGIAERLVISEKTAVRHVSNIFGKLGVHTRAEAARVAAEAGLTTPPATA